MSKIDVYNWESYEDDENFERIRRQKSTETETSGKKVRRDWKRIRRQQERERTNG